MGVLSWPQKSYWRFGFKKKFKNVTILLIYVKGLDPVVLETEI
jgi:hypothetical protein